MSDNRCLYCNTTGSIAVSAIIPGKRMCTACLKTWTLEEIPMEPKEDGGISDEIQA